MKFLSILDCCVAVMNAHQALPTQKNKVNKHDTITEKAAQHVQLYTTTELDDVERTGGKEFGSSESN